MMTLQHRFVDYIPDDLEQNVLYISMAFATVVHKCACGCNAEVVTPLAPLGWQLVFDGESVSLTPSIGSWSLPCRSHYFIRKNMVQWAQENYITAPAPAKKKPPKKKRTKFFSRPKKDIRQIDVACLEEKKFAN